MAMSDYVGPHGPMGTSGLQSGLPKQFVASVIPRDFILFQSNTIPDTAICIKFIIQTEFKKIVWRMSKRYGIYAICINIRTYYHRIYDIHVPCKFIVCLRTSHTLFMCLHVCHIVRHPLQERGLARPMFFNCFYPLLGPGTSPIRFVSEIRAILKYLCIRSSDVVSKLALGRFVFDVWKLRNSPDH